LSGQATDTLEHSERVYLLLAVLATTVAQKFVFVMEPEPIQAARLEICRPVLRIMLILNEFALSLECCDWLSAKRTAYQVSVALPIDIAASRAAHVVVVFSSRWYRLQELASPSL